MAMDVRYAGNARAFSGIRESWRECQKMPEHFPAQNFNSSGTHSV